MENEETPEQPRAQIPGDSPPGISKDSQEDADLPDAPGNEERIFQAEAVEDVIDVEVIEDAATGGESPGKLYRTAEPVINKGSPFAIGAPAQFPATANVYVASPVWMPEYERYSARAGAVVAFYLGVVSILGGLLTPMALVNAFFGLLFGLWGLSSERKRTAVIGIVLCGVGFCVTIVRFAISVSI